MTKFITVKHSVTGRVGNVPESYLGHPVLGKYLEPADDPGCTTCGQHAAEPEVEAEPEVAFDNYFDEVDYAG